MVINQQGQSRLRLYSILLSVVILFINLGIVLFIQDERLKVILFQLPSPLWSLLAALGLFYAANRSARYSRRLALAWGLLAAGRLLLFIGEITTLALTIQLGATPFPSLADAFFLIFYPLFLLGILLLPVQHLKSLAWVKMGLDMSVMLFASVLVLWIYWIGPLVADVSDERIPVQILSLAYPVGSIVLLWALLMLLYRPSAGQKRGPLLLLACGIAMQIVMAFLYGYHSILSNVISEWLSLGWLLTNLIFGVAGIWQATSVEATSSIAPMASDEAAPTKLNTWHTYLPYAFVLIDFVIFRQINQQDAPADADWLTWGIGLIIGLVLVRQTLTLHENSRLFAQLQQKGVALSQTNQELRETQAMLIHAEKMNALGQMVAGVAHEINNPVAFVNSNIHGLKQMVTRMMTAYTGLEQLALATGTAETKTAVATFHKEADIDFLREDLDDLVDTSLGGLTRVRKIVDGLRNFSRLDEADYKWADLREGIESSVLIAHVAIKNRITVDLDLPDLPPLQCRPAELNQVFLNLILNAAHAIEDKGTITITGRDAGSELILTFRDTGCGMSAATMQQIFNPFFTTKPVGVGTGLGLSIAYKIITAGHGGTIDVASEPGHGTTFTIRLPKEHHP